LVVAVRLLMWKNELSSQDLLPPLNLL
jgi:hypothetical protein